MAVNSKTQDGKNSGQDGGPDGARGVVQSGGAEGTPPLDFDDDEIYSGRGRVRDGGTTHSSGGDGGKLGPPAEQLSGSNGPSDPANRKGRQ